jgi:acyl-CoA dehydrogenase
VKFVDFLDADLQQWRAACHRFMDREITREYVRECDMERRYYTEGYAKLAKAGYLGVLVPESYGGMGGTNLAYALLCEALGKFGVDFAIAVSVSTFSAMNLMHYGTEQHIAAHIPGYLAGTVPFCVAISEPESGSDAASVSTRAVRDGDSYVLTGLKQWCSGSSAPGAQIFMLVRTAPNEAKHAGLSVLLVPNDLESLTLRKLKTLARRGTGTNQIFLVRAGKSSRSTSCSNGYRWRRRMSGARSRPSTTRWRTLRCASNSASRYSISRRSITCWPTCRRGSTRRACSCTGRPRAQTPMEPRRAM